MTRKECLEQAMDCVLRDRASQYGGPEDNFGRIARLWSVYTGTVLDGIDVAMMMALLKVARIRNNKGYEDGYIDLAGYAACGAELPGAEKAREDAVRRAGEEYKKFRAESEAKDFEELAMADAEEVEKAFGKPDGGCCQNGKDHSPEEPEFKPGDAVEWNGVGSDWLPAVFQREFGDFGFCVVRFPDGRERLVSKIDLRKAEANHPENPESLPEFKPGEKVEVHSLTTKVWQEATIVDADKEHTLYRVRFPYGTVSIRPACYVRHVVKEDKPQAEGCEELVQRIKEVTPAIYGEKEQD